MVGKDADVQNHGSHRWTDQEKGREKERKREREGRGQEVVMQPFSIRGPKAVTMIGRQRERGRKDWKKKKKRMDSEKEEKMERRGDRERERGDEKDTDGEKDREEKRG